MSSTGSTSWTLIEAAVQKVIFAFLRETSAIGDRSRSDRFRAFRYGIARNTAVKV